MPDRDGPPAYIQVRLSRPAAELLLAAAPPDEDLAFMPGDPAYGRAALELSSGLRTALAPDPVRTAGDDIVIQLRIRRANLPQLEEGTELGIDSLTGKPIELRLVPQPDGVHGLEVVTNPFAYLLTPEPVDVRVEHGDDHAG